MKPMLAATLKSPEDIKEWSSILVSPKLDGIRAIVKNGIVLSRSLKPIPNRYVQDMFGHLENLDGELIVGEPTGPTAYRDTMSGVMSRDGQPDVRFWVFDYQAPGTFEERYHEIAKFGLAFDNVPLVQLNTATSAQHFKEVYESYLEQGYEGIMLRSRFAPYKHGRSTLREGSLIKYKPIEDAEATIVGFTERMHNANEATINELGYTARSGHQANMVPMGTLGALVCEAPQWTERFQMGTGFDDSLRAWVWENRTSMLGRLVKFSYLPYGIKDRPRHPVFKGFRDSIDL